MCDIDVVVGVAVVATCLVIFIFNVYLYVCFLCDDFCSVVLRGVVLLQTKKNNNSNNKQQHPKTTTTTVAAESMIRIYL